TSKFVRLTVEGYSKNDLASVLKHFPGYGENEDTHTGTAVDNRELSKLVSKDFAPFAAGIKAGADCILVSHNIINKVDEEYPASLSAKVHALIRDKLGFEGVIMTDDLIMEAITEYIGDENAAVLAVKSGNDLILSSNYEEQYPAVLDAVKTGEITEKQLDASVKRILTMKLKRGIIE
ncbi:MAG: beta-hexosaminidase, partial [Ruminococcus sp.]|nr:beta-hexosaminidase [Ruminococcus sp.]